jgi:phage-related protein
MANGADGSIVIDTQLDNTGFQRGSQQMQRAVNSLNNSVNQTGQNMNSAVQSMNTALQNMGAAAQSAGSKFTQYLGAGQFDRAMGEVQKSAQSLVSDLAKIGNAEAAGVKPGAQYQRLVTNIQDAERELATLKGQMDQMSGHTFETSEFTQLKSQIEKAEQALFKLYDRRDVMQELGVSENTQSWKLLEIHIRNAEEELERLERSRDAMMQNGSATVNGADTAQFQQMAAMYQQMQDALETYKQAAAEFNVIEQPANESEQALKAVDRELKQKGPDASEAGGFLSGFGNILKGIAGTALHAAGGLAKLTFKGVAAGAKGAVAGIQRFNSALKNLRSHSNKSVMTSNGLVKALFSVKRMLLSRIKRTFISSIFNSMKAGMQSFARYSSSFNSAMSSMKNSMTGMSGNMAVFAGNLISAIAPAISTIIDWISKAITYLNAFFALLSGKSTYSVAKKGTDDYAKSLKGAGGAAKDLKNQVYGFDELNKEDDNSGGGGGGSGGGVNFTEESLSTLPPALLDFMQSIKDAFAAEQFEEVGAIVGRGLNSIVATVDNWINNTLRPLAVTWAANIARILNGLVTAFDWTALGTLFASGINTISDTLNTFFTTFDFDALAGGIADGINGLFDGVDWDLLGQTVGNGFAGIETIIWGTLAGINWIQFGSNLSNGVNSMFAAVNWGKLGTDVGTALKGIVNGISEFLRGTDWQAIGNDTATYVQSIDWNGLVDALTNGIGVALASIAELIWGFIQPGWDSVVTWWNEAMAKNGGDVIGTLLEGIVTALEGIGQWCLDHIISPLLGGIESALGLEEGSLLSMATQLWDMFKSAVETAWNAIKDTVGKFFTGVWEAITGFFGNLGEVADNIWDGFLEGVSGAWSKIKDAVSSVIKGAWELIKAGFGKLSEIAESIWEGFGPALSAAWNKVSSAVTKIFSDAWEAIKKVFADIGDVATNLWEGLKKGLSEGWTKLKNFILKPFEDMWQAIKDFFGIASPSTEAASIGDFILQGLVSGFSAAVEGVISAVKTIFGRIWDAIKSIFGFGSESDESKEAKQAGKDIMTGMEQGIKGDEETVKAEIRNAGKVALQALRQEIGVPDKGGASTKTKVYGEGLVTGLSDGIVSKAVEQTFTNAANKAWQAVRSALNTAFGTKEGGSASKAKYVGETTVQGVNDGINSKSKSSTFTSVATAALTAVKSALNTAFGMASDTTSASKTKYSGEGIVKGIVDGIKDKAVQATFTSVANSVYDAISKAMNTALGISGGGWWGGNTSSSKFKDVGKAICQGVADGIDANTSTIKSAAERAAQAALTAAKNKLGIHSPSKAFAEIGNFMMEGMSNGLKDGQGEVARTVSDIAGALTDGMSGTTFDVGADAMVSGLDQVADKFMTFVNRLEAAANALVDGILPQPAIATGVYAPPRTRIGETAGTGIDGFASEMRRQEAGRDELFYMIRDEIREGFTALLRKDNSIDGASLERTLDTLRRDRVRAFGGA